MNEIVVLVAIERERMYHLDLTASLIKIQPHSKRQPLAMPVGAVPVYVDNGAHLPLSFDECSVYETFVIGKLQTMDALLLGLVLCGADEMPMLGNARAVKYQTVNQRFAFQRNVSLQRPGINK